MGSKMISASLAARAVKGDGTQINTEASDATQGNNSKSVFSVERLNMTNNKNTPFNSVQRALSNERNKFSSQRRMVKNSFEVPTLQNAA